MTAAVPQRLLPLQGGRNFRDLGGYEAHDGRRVRWGQVFRSGSLAGLTAADWEGLQARGVRVLCDLRTNMERQHEPFPWAQAPGISYFARDYNSSFGELRRLMSAGLPSGAVVREAMINSYRQLPFEQAPSYRRLFTHLAANEIPMVFNCSAGKDRAGTAAALLLGALGIPRETIVEDFELTNSVGRLREVLGRTTGSLLSMLPGEVADAILGADPDYIAAALGSVEERHGSIEGYLDQVLEIDAAALERIRGNLLE